MVSSSLTRGCAPLSVVTVKKKPLDGNFLGKKEEIPIPTILKRSCVKTGFGKLVLENSVKKCNQHLLVSLEMIFPPGK